MDLFELQAVLRLNSQPYQQGIQEAEEQGTSFLDRVGNAYTSARSKIQTVTTVLRPVIDVVESAVDSFSSYQQSMGGVEAIFGNMATTVRDNAMNAFRAAGMSMNDYLETATSLGARLMQDLGGDAEAAAETVDRLIAQMADNASVYGTSLDDVAAVYRSISMGRYQMLDNLRLGYGGTQEEMQRLLDDAEEIYSELHEGATIEFDISNYADIIQAIGLVQEHIGISGNAAREAGNTVTGSLNSMRAAWDNLLTLMADPNAEEDDKNTMIAAFSASLGQFLQNIEPIITTAITSLITVITQLIPSLLRQLTPLIPQIVTFLVTLLTSSSSSTSLVKVLAFAVVTGLAALFDVLLTMLVSIFDRSFETRGSAFSQWGVYDWLETAFGINGQQMARYRHIETSRGGVQTEGNVTAETPADVEVPEVAADERDAVLAGLMELYGFNVSDQGETYLDQWRATFEAAEDDAMERNMGLLGLTNDAIEGMHEVDALSLAAMMDRVLELESLGDLTAVAQQMHQLYAAVALLNQGYFAGSAFTGGDLLRAVTGNFLDPTEYAAIIARIQGIGTEIDTATRERTVSIGFTIGEYTGEGEDATQNATGLWDVPYDNYLARLHRDEMVLNATNARDYREGNLNSTGAIVAELAGLRNDMQHLQMVVGERVFGQTVVDYSGRRMSGFLGRAEDSEISGYGG